MEFKDSRTAKGLRAYRALHKFHAQLISEGDAPSATIIAQLLELPFGSMCTLGEAFEHAMNAELPEVDA